MIISLKVGGGVISGTSLGRTDNTSSITFCGGTDANNGGAIELRGKDKGGNVFIDANDGTQFNRIHLRPNGDTNLTHCEVFYSTTDNFTRLGHPAYRWTEVCAATSTINTSDLRLKNTITDIDDNLLDAWETIQPKQYKFNDASEKKGDLARFHTGYIAQDIQKACTDNNLDISKYGLFCYDSWDEQPEIYEDVEVEKDGVKTTEKRIVQQKREKGDIYALRYEETLVVECAYLRRENSRLKERLSKIEKLLNI